MKKLLFTIVSLFISSVLFAQSADEITKIINSEKATYGQTCYLTAVYQNLVKENATETDAMNSWFEENQLQKKAVSPDTEITYQDACYYFAKMWNINGSLFFRITKGSPRYAYKQLKKDGVIPSNADPTQIPSGTDLLNIYTSGHLIYVSEMEAAE